MFQKLKRFATNTFVQQVDLIYLCKNFIINITFFFFLEIANNIVNTAMKDGMRVLLLFVMNYLYQKGD